LILEAILVSDSLISFRRKIVITSELKTASDDWFSDFNDSGFATIATGRLPARTASDMQTIVDKILNYTNGPGGKLDKPEHDGC